MGWIYRRKKRDPETKQLKETGPFWIGYFIDGHPRREGTGTWKHKEAERILKEREGRVAKGEQIPLRADRVRVEELLDDLKAHYQTTGCRNLKEAEGRLVKRTDWDCFPRFR